MFLTCILMYLVFKLYEHVLVSEIQIEWLLAAWIYIDFTNC